eukprot:9098709-Pyramimonas_sp.AAC.1
MSIRVGFGSHRAAAIADSWAARALKLTTRVSQASGAWTRPREFWAGAQPARCAPMATADVACTGYAECGGTASSERR